MAMTVVKGVRAKGYRSSTPMGVPSDDAVAAAREAIAQGDWARALELYQTAVAGGPLSPAELETMPFSGSELGSS